MSDPLSVAAGIVAILQLSATVVKYLQHVKDSSGDRRRLRDEIRSSACLLEMLRDRIEDIDSEPAYCGSIASLNALHGPLDQFKKALKSLVLKLEPSTSLRQKMSWPFDKAEITATLNAIERQKSYFSLALENYHMY